MTHKVLMNLPSARWVIPPEPAPVRDGRQCLQSWAKFTGVPPTTQPLSFFVCSQWLKSYTCKLVIDDWPSVRHLLKDSSMQFFSCSLSHSKTHLISDTSSRLRGSELVTTEISDIVENADIFLLCFWYGSLKAVVLIFSTILWRILSIFSNLQRLKIRNSNAKTFCSSRHHVLNLLLFCYMQFQDKVLQLIFLAVLLMLTHFSYFKLHIIHTGKIELSKYLSLLCKQ